MLFRSITGDFAALETETLNKTDAESRYAHFTAMVCLGRVEEAIKQFPPEENKANDPYHFLNTAIALRAAGNTAEAKRWFDLGLAALDKGDEDMEQVATMLRRNAPPALADTDELTQSADAKSVTLVTLAQLHPSVSRDYLPRIEKLNVEPGYQQHLLKQAIAKMK